MNNKELESAYNILRVSFYDFWKVYDAKESSKVKNAIEYLISHVEQLEKENEDLKETIEDILHGKRIAFSVRGSSETIKE